MNILLAEDHEEISDFLSRRLARRGYTVTVATDGARAVERAKGGAFDLVLLDMNMPVLDGWSAANCMRADARTQKLPIIALTAHAMAGDRERALAAGCTDYHSKPIDFARLLGQIEVHRPATRAEAVVG